MKYPHFKALKPIITKAFLSNEHIQCLGVENFEENFDFEITGVAQTLFENDVDNSELERQLALWFSASFPERDWDKNQFTSTVTEIKTNLKKIENV